MNSLVLNPLPEPLELDALRVALRDKKLRIAELEEQLAAERAKRMSTERSVEELRGVLLPLYSGLQVVFGHFEEIGVSGNGSAAPAASAQDAVWESWKQKLGGLTAKAIDALRLHGPMNKGQLRIQLRCATGSVTNIVTALNKAGLINKNGNMIALKELNR
jgi:hypothetical protein